MNTDASRALPWKVRPVFISSTFRDMQAERDHLRTVVFPRLEDELRKGRLLIEPVDLRQGVETAELPSEEAREQSVLKVCLEEIERSRPFLIVLLGDRYGWVPPESRVSEAVQEAGFVTELAQKSVTALEIEYGILRRDRAEPPRCLIYLRESLPYGQMPESLRADYSDEFAADPQVRARHERLGVLKKSLAGNPELHSRVHHYRARWESDLRKVAGLEEWGEHVYQHLISELRAEAQGTAAAQEPTWQEQERADLAEFETLRRRDFTGRAGLLSVLEEIAVAESPSEALSAIAAGITWGACVSGEAGRGKSALFAELTHRLRQHDSIVLLTNAAGATPRGAQVEAMLERFIGELSGLLGVPTPPLLHADAASVEATFASLLARVAARRRVVVLLDALDQFEPSPRGQTLTWLRPKQWPANARLIATALPGAAAEALSQWAGIEELEIEPLTNSDDEGDDVSAIATAVWKRYHRQINSAVLRALRSKRIADGGWAAGNALWLTLAAEQLNLLDSDDFARAERDFTGDPAERLQAFSVHLTERMPPSVPGLYGWLLEHTERVVGQPAARAFAALIAISRSGWRESDLLRLVPAAAQLLSPSQPLAEWNDLRLATLRRSFRAHLARHGSPGQLDFFHSQMREAVRLRILTDEDQVRCLHRLVADHLESLPPGDPLRISELMVHLIAGRDAPRAARVYAELDDGPALAASTDALVQHIRSIEESGRHSDIVWATELPSASLTPTQRGQLATRMVFHLNTALEGKAMLVTRRMLLHSAEMTLEDLLRAEPGQVDWLTALSFARANRGHIAKAEGDFNQARHFYSEASRLMRCVSESRPDDLEKAGTHWASLLRLSEIARIQGDVAGLQQIYEECHEIAKSRTQRHPENPEWQSLLSVSHERLSNVAIALRDWPANEHHLRESHRIRLRLVQSHPDDERWQDYLAMSFDDLAELAAAHGDHVEAERLCRERVTIRQRLVERKPADDNAHQKLAVATITLGEMVARQGRLEEASRLLDEGHRTLQRLADADPTDTARQNDLALSLERLGRLAQARGDLALTERCLRECFRIRRAIAAMDDENSDSQRKLSHALIDLGNFALSRGQLEAAQQYFGESHQIAERLSFVSPDNSEFQRQLAYSHYNLGIVAHRKGDSRRFLGEMRQSYEIIQRIRQGGLSLVDPELESMAQRLSQLFGGS